MKRDQLTARQKWPLELKVAFSIKKIIEFYDVVTSVEFEEEYGSTGAYVSVAGIQSGTVLRKLVELAAEQDPRLKDIKFVSVGAAECPENNKHNNEKGVIFLPPKKAKDGGWDKKWVITKYGYPVISKQVAMAIDRYHRATDPKIKEKRLYGELRDGKRLKTGTIPLVYHFLIFAPFDISEQCCVYTKEGPLKKYTKESHTFPITGEMATDSNGRMRKYLQNGCIIDYGNSIKCTPMGFWTEQDVMQFILFYDEDYSEAYEDIEMNDTSEYEYTGEPRTGCPICAFGILHDPLRFERMKEKKPNMYKHVMGGGQWIRKEKYRWVKFRPESIPIWSNLYWVPSDDGFGYGFVMNYIKSLF